MTFNIVERLKDKFPVLTFLLQQLYTDVFSPVSLFFLSVKVNKTLFMIKTLHTVTKHESLLRSKVFAVSLRDCEFEYHRDSWLGVQKSKNQPRCLGGRDDVLYLTCQSECCQLVIDVYELVKVEKRLHQQKARLYTSQQEHVLDFNFPSRHGKILRGIVVTQCTGRGFSYTFGEVAVMTSCTGQRFE